MKNIIQTDWKKLIYTLLRMAIGWHFLYEGISKLIIQDWSSYSYLANSTGPFSGFYHWLAASEGILRIIDLLNIYGLILIGIALFIGLFFRIAAIAGTFLLILYYFAYPPFGESLFNIGDGHLFIVDKIFIEVLALLFFVFYKEKGFGIEHFIELIKKPRHKAPTENIPYSYSRRNVLKNLATLPFLGLMGVWTAKSIRKFGVDVMSGATIQLDQAALGELNGTLPKDGFNWAFENGADFICVGMFDFQLVKDVNICIDTLNNLNNRKREWFG